MPWWNFTRNRRTNLNIEALEERLAPVVGALAVPAPTPRDGVFSGVVKLTQNRGTAEGLGTGSLLYTGRHILTAAHVVDSSTDANIAPDGPVTVVFELSRDGKPIDISLKTPVSNILVHPSWNNKGSDGNDLALLTLTDPENPAPDRHLVAPFGAERYDLYRDRDEVGQEVTFVGYGRTGTGAGGANGPAGVKRLGANTIDRVFLGFFNPLLLSSDFDNGRSENDFNGGDASGLGNRETSTAPADSGGPVFIGNRIAGVVSFGEGGGRKDFNPNAIASFGDHIVNTRVSSYADSFIDPSVTAAPYHLVLDMNHQVFGRDGKIETISILARQNGELLEILVQNLSTNVPELEGRYFAAPLADLRSLTIRGSDDHESITVQGDLGIPVTLDGRGGNDTIFGSSGPDSILGGDGNDVLVGFGGDDTIRGGKGNDTLTGGDGNDILDGGENDDTVREFTDPEGDPNLKFVRNGVLNQLLGRGGDLLFDVEALDLIGDDRVNRLHAAAFQGTTRMEGRGGNDELIGSKTHFNELIGGAGDDLLIGWNQRSNLLGGQGSDVFVGGPGSVTDGVVDLAITRNESVPETVLVGATVLYKVEFASLAGENFDAANFVTVAGSISGAVVGPSYNFDFGEIVRDPETGEDTGHRIIRPGQSFPLPADPQGTAVGPPGGVGLNGVEVQARTSLVKDVNPINNQSIVPTFVTAIAPPPIGGGGKQVGGKVQPISVTPDGTQTGSTGGNSENVPFFSKKNGIANNGQIAFVTGQNDTFSNVSGTTGRHAALGDPILVDVTNAGVVGNGDVSDSVISADGRFIAFTSRASNLTGIPDGPGTDVFVKDLQTGEIRLVSINAAGNGSGNGDSFSPKLSADGRFVFFLSSATNLVNATADTNGGNDLFVRDLVSNTTQVVSIANSGTSTGNRPVGLQYEISSDGRFVVFQSLASDLDPGVTPSTTTVQNLYWRDRQTQTTRIVSSNAAGNDGGNRDSSRPTLSDDGRFVYFDSPASNLVAGTFNNIIQNVYLRDVTAFTTTLVTANILPNFPLTGGGDHSSVDDATPDGRFLVFVSNARNFYEGPSLSGQQLFLYDRVANEFTIITLTPDRQQGANNQASGAATISDDGRFIAFSSLASNLVTGVTDTNNTFDAFVFDRIETRTTVLSVTPDGTQTGNSFSGGAAISGDGRLVFFQSNATNLVAGLIDTNGTPDLFVSDAHVFDGSEQGSGLFFTAPAGAANNLVLRRNGDNLQIVNGVNNQVLNEAPLANVTFVGITGAVNTNDTLTIDFAFGGFFALSQGVQFDGGDGGNDSLVIRGGSFDRVSYTATGPDAGGILFENAVGRLGVGYTGLEPIRDESTAVDRLFRTFLAGDVQVRLRDAAGAFMTLDDNGTGAFEQVTFANPTGSLTVITGDGNDLLLAASVDAAFTGLLVLDGGRGNDRLDASALTRAVTLADGFGNDTLIGGSGDTTYRLTLGGNDRIEDTGGNDTLDFRDALLPVAINMDLVDVPQILDAAGSTLTMVGRIENFVGSAFDDAVQATPLNVVRVLNGGQGSNDLQVTNLGQAATNANGVLAVNGFANINHLNFDNVDFGVPIGIADEYVLLEDEVLEVNAAEGVLANDSDPDGSPLQATVAIGPSRGQLTLNPDGSFRYVPNPDFHGTDSFTYTVSDGGLSQTVAVTLIVSPVADAPEVTDVIATTAPGVPLTLNVVASVRDADPGDEVFVVDVGPAANGTVEIIDGKVVYTPDEGFEGDDEFDFLISDGDGNTTSALAFVRVAVPPPPPPPPPTPQVAPTPTAAVPQSTVTATLIGGRLVLIGDDAANHVEIQLGRNRVTVLGRNGTVINGQSEVTFFGVTKGLRAFLLGGDDRFRVVGSRFRGPVLLNGGAGNDLYSIAARGLDVTIRDPQGNRDRIGFAGASYAVELDLNRHDGSAQRVGGGNTVRLESRIEDATGSPHNDVLRGIRGVSRLRGGGGVDNLLTASEQDA